MADASFYLKIGRLYVESEATIEDSPPDSPEIALKTVENRSMFFLPRALLV
eukprot:m.263072 g.263072  ORF g.263072 m.263072 type:complete len:51 (+) comp40453_c2_seq12:1122-1274(+)